MDLSLEKAWELLSEAVSDRRSPLHMPAIGTVTEEGLPSQRIMVLRSADPEKRQLRFNTDARVSKVRDIGNGAPVSVLGYHPEAKIQLRLTGTGHIHRDGPRADAAWDQASLYGQRCYLAEPAPGSAVEEATSGLPADIEGRKPTEEQVEPARANFAILLVDVVRIEWLYLAHTGHRRAASTWDSRTGDWQHEWLVP
ncbi:pyridoxamine 5'-phosphate oxidase family protein [Parasphingorhabdus marina]|uniref:pyridoxamine 5'-phosphate oxidase family protein n=1 Tax=Parasphingorhabdus marina TaxID=394732 RepID=UPI001EF75200|nr:pyridoxamine 5'-phosphate oxidase family protein [Parasphingorhabdus marina]